MRSNQAHTARTINATNAFVEDVLAQDADFINRQLPTLGDWPARMAVLEAQRGIARFLRPAMREEQRPKTAPTPAPQEIRRQNYRANTSALHSQGHRYDPIARRIRQNYLADRMLREMRVRQEMHCREMEERLVA